MVVNGLKFGDYSLGPQGPPFFIGAVRNVNTQKIDYVKYLLDIGGDLCSIDSAIIAEHECPHVANIKTSVGSGGILASRKVYSNLDIIIPVSPHQIEWRTVSFPSPKTAVRSYRRENAKDFFLASKYPNTSIIGSEFLYHWGLQVHLDYGKKLLIIRESS